MGQKLLLNAQKGNSKRGAFSFAVEFFEAIATNGMLQELQVLMEVIIWNRNVLFSCH